VNENLLPSPSSFYPEWGFGRSGPDSALLPSPLPFPTPIGPSASQGFGRGEAETIGDKRKGSEERLGEQKKVKI
jgi:MADS-box transcription factor